MAMNANESTNAKTTASTCAAARKAGDAGSSSATPAYTARNASIERIRCPGVAALPFRSFRIRSPMDSGKGGPTPLRCSAGGRVASSVQLSVEDACSQRGGVDAGEYVMQVLELVEAHAEPFDHCGRNRQGLAT